MLLFAGNHKKKNKIANENSVLKLTLSMSDGRNEERKTFASYKPKENLFDTLGVKRSVTIIALFK